MKVFLGVDGGGSKTAFLLIDESGKLLAVHTEGPAYYLEIGWDAMRTMLTRGIETIVQHAALRVSDLEFAFLGLPAYGEDSSLLPQLDTAASPPLTQGRYRCGNDALCGWAGTLACQDGINIIAGTGSMAYGEFAGRSARAGGWGELFSDEGSAYWIAREGLNLFSRMSDGRAARGPLYDILRRHFGLQSDLDLCAAIYGQSRIQRSNLAALAPLIAQAATAGDPAAKGLFTAAARELAAIIAAVRSQLSPPTTFTMPVSYSGGMFQQRELMLAPLQALLDESPGRYRLVAPRLSPVAGAALYAAKLSGTLLSDTAIATLERQLPR